MPPAGRGAGRVALVTLATLSLGAQCQGDPLVTLYVVVPSGLAGTARWIEVAVVGSSCPSPAALAGGLPRSGTLGRFAFGQGASALPTIGTLPKGTYGFAAARTRRPVAARSS